MEFQDQPSWSYDDIVDQSLDESFLYGLDMDLHMVDCEFSCPNTTNDDTLEIFPTSHLSTDDLPIWGDDIQVLSPFENLLNLEDFSSNLSNEIDDISQCEWIEATGSIFGSEHSSNQQEYEASPSSSTSNMYVVESSQLVQPSLIDVVESSQLVQPSLILPTEDMNIDNQVVIPHLLHAYGDARGNEEGELAEVIVKRIKEKVSPLGASIERLAYYLFESLEKHDYLIQESNKNYEAAFKAFYQIFPYGRFAHFSANLAILEAMPKDTDTIHIIDFDMGDGVQWPPFIEAIGQHKSVRLTSIKWKENEFGCSAPHWRFEVIKRQLCDHAHSSGVKLEVDEMDMEEIVNMKTSSRGREWLVFNVMLGLPHMGRVRSTRNAMEFLKVAKELITKTSTRGIVVFGDGDCLKRTMGNCDDFSSYFHKHLEHFNAMFESIDWHFPSQFREAKIAMECLFVAPFVSSYACFQKWRECKAGCDMETGFGLEGCRLSGEIMEQAKEMVREGEGLYGVRIEGEKENEMVLEWGEIPLVRVSTWR